MSKIIIGKINSKVGFHFKDSKTNAVTNAALWQPTAQPLQLVGAIHIRGNEIDNYGCCAVKNCNGIPETVTLSNISPRNNLSAITSVNFTLTAGQMSDWYILRRSQTGSVISTPSYIIADSDIKGRSGYIDAVNASFAYTATPSTNKGITTYITTNKLLVASFWNNYTLPKPLASIGCGKLDTNVIRDFAIPSNNFTDSWAWPAGSKDVNHGTVAAIDDDFSNLDSSTKWLSVRTTSKQGGGAAGLSKYYDSLKCFILPLLGTTGRSRGADATCPFTYALDSDPSKSYPLYWGMNTLESSKNGYFSTSTWSTQYRIFYKTPAVVSATGPCCALLIEDSANTWTFSAVI